MLRKVISATETSAINFKLFPADLLLRIKELTAADTFSHGYAKVLKFKKAVFSINQCNANTFI